MVDMTQRSAREPPANMILLVCVIIAIKSLHDSYSMYNISLATLEAGCSHGTPLKMIVKLLR
ncbi:hypothetical protein PISMIDRAFT_682846 [Pisolithus microcarpus 441]|uniref:Uncharacterized protein n=1 Tax=Pisolithus microcarpus 441 TaxID=765257 RepID=A0A0C9ZI48_9AGAM|nr:hypothetical protein PISMIDRAFT_682846 [Pisolithus microcarpus 441]